MEYRSDGRGVRRYFILTYAISLLSWGTMIALKMPGGSTDPSSPPPSTVALLLLLLGGFAPSIAGVVLTAWVGGRAGLRDLWARVTRFGLGWKAYAFIIVFPLMAVGLQAATYLLNGGVTKSSALFQSLTVLIVFTIQIILFGPITEEIGWRGFALEALLARWRPLGASLVLGVLWAFWHLPLFFVQGTSQANFGNPLIEFPAFALVPIGSAVVYTWLYLGTGRSTWSALALHFTMNFTVSAWATLAADSFLGRLTWGLIFIVAAVVIAIGWRRSAQGIPAQA